VLTDIENYSLWSGLVLCNLADLFFMLKLSKVDNVKKHYMSSLNCNQKFVEIYILYTIGPVNSQKSNFYHLSHYSNKMRYFITISPV